MDPRGEHAPEAYEALCRLEASAFALVPDELLDRARRQSPDDVVGRFSEQFVVDVTQVDVAPLAAELGDLVGPFVSALWVLDMGNRTDTALARLFDVDVPARKGEVVDYAVAFDDFLTIVARLSDLDPVTTELVRLRGARFHNCRICQSLRTASALKAGGSEDLYDQIDRYESSDMSEAQKVALRLTDAMVTSPALIDAELAAQAHEHFTDAQLVELALDIMRNAANKVAVAFGADEARISEGWELYDVLPTGEVVYDL
jgi:alkylhydroperoxidase family enzyme